MDIVLTTPAKRPDLIPQMLALLTKSWPQFLLQGGAPGPDDPPTDWSTFISAWPTHQIVLLDGDAVVATGHAVPLSWDDHCPPQTGWDWAVAMAGKGSKLVTLCALAVTIAPTHRGRGLSTIALDGLRDVAVAHGLRRMIVPVRPNHKHRWPQVSFKEYLTQKTEEGLPIDPWLRTHIRRGGKILGVCERSMELAGYTDDWERWTGVRVSDDGPTVIPQALVPVIFANGVGRYIEPNVWVEHHLKTPPTASASP